MKFWNVFLQHTFSLCLKRTKFTSQVFLHFLKVATKKAKPQSQWTILFKPNKESKVTQTIYRLVVDHFLYSLQINLHKYLAAKFSGPLIVLRHHNWNKVNLDSKYCGWRKTNDHKMKDHKILHFMCNQIPFKINKQPIIQHMHWLAQTWHIQSWNVRLFMHPYRWVFRIQKACIL